jgi:hypothetical protein
VTRAERVLASRWRSAFLACVLVAISGAVILIWARMDHANSRIDAETTARQSAVAEANRRGGAVSTLAADVRALRAQVQAAGGSPVAPDPATAVSNLPARLTVPIPIPGPAGAPGASGQPGRPGPAGSPGSPGPSGVPGSPGATGVAGASGQDGSAGIPGPAGPAGQDGKDGTNGRDGAPGQPPAGWTWAWTDPVGTVHTYSCGPVDGFDPSSPRYQCSESAPASPTPTPSALSPPPALPDRRRV